MKIKIHFNRVNMQRGDNRVWTAHTYKNCNQAQKIVVRHGNKTVLKTVFKPKAAQPRAYLEVDGNVHYEGNTLFVEV